LNSNYVKGIEKSFSIKQKCSEEEKKIYGVNFKTSKIINRQIFELKLEDTKKNVFLIKADYQMLDKIIKEDVFFKSLTKAKKFVEQKVKEFELEGK
jgi:hypothetical protein